MRQALSDYEEGKCTSERVMSAYELSWYSVKTALFEDASLVLTAKLIAYSDTILAEADIHSHVIKDNKYRKI